MGSTRTIDRPPAPARRAQRVFQYAEDALKTSQLWFGERSAAIKAVDKFQSLSGSSTLWNALRVADESYFAFTPKNDPHCKRVLVLLTLNAIDKRILAGEKIKQYSKSLSSKGVKVCYLGLIDKGTLGHY